MEYDAVIQASLDMIDQRILENIQVAELARNANYSLYHFCRVFLNLTGMSVKNYITRRKLEYALYDLLQGERIIDVAMNYGFETHAGFTKAFKKCFGYPPSLCRLHIAANLPERMTIERIKQRKEEIYMQAQIKEMSSFFVVGVVSRHSLPNVKRISDIPAYWNTIGLDYGKHLTRLYDTFKPKKHGEFALRLDVNEESREFDYLLGVIFDENADTSKMEPDMQKFEIPGGTYAVFTTPKVPDEKYPQSIADTWASILTEWLPKSEYMYDETRPDFESYDERDHAGLVQMDIYIPVRKRGSCMDGRKETQN